MTKTVTAYQKYIRQTPQKLRLMADLIRPMSVEEALTQLKLSSKRGSKVMHKVLTQARANALNTGLRSETLKIKEVDVQEGATYKRWQPVSRGRAHSILKRTCHIKITLEGTDQVDTKPKKKQEKKGK